MTITPLYTTKNIYKNLFNLTKRGTISLFYILLGYRDKAFHSRGERLVGTQSHSKLARYLGNDRDKSHVCLAVKYDKLGEHTDSVPMLNHGDYSRIVDVRLRDEGLDRIFGENCAYIVVKGYFAFKYACGIRGDRTCG